MGFDLFQRDLCVHRFYGPNIHTFPTWVLCGAVGVGGCDDLYALERSGQLDALLGA